MKSEGRHDIMNSFKLIFEERVSQCNTTIAKVPFISPRIKIPSIGEQNEKISLVFFSD